MHDQNILKYIATLVTTATAVEHYTLVITLYMLTLLLIGS